MKIQLRRVILFTHQFAAMRDFYRDNFELDVIEEVEGWVDFDGGECRLSIHAAGAGVTVGPEWEGPHKIAFYTADVEGFRAVLLSRGVPMGEIHRFGTLQLCDGSDPDRNCFQVSNRP